MIDDNRIREMVYFGAYHSASPAIGEHYTAAVRDHASDSVWGPVVRRVHGVKESLIMALREKKTWT